MRYAIRSLLKARTFAAVAIATLAIGIGAATAVFSIVDAVLFRPLPFRDPARLVVFSGTSARRGATDAAFSNPAYVWIAEASRSFSDISAYTSDQFTVTGSDRPEERPGGRVSASFFDVIGVGAAAGRTFTRDEDRPDHRVIVLGRRYWTERFGRDPRAVGTTMTLNGAPYTIVGALGVDLPEPFSNVDLWTTRPEDISGFTPAQVEAGLGYLSAVARLGDGVAIAQAQAEMNGIWRAYAQAHPTNTDADPDGEMRLVPVRERAVAGARPSLALLAAAVGLVLLVSCANVANLLLVRATSRSHEAAVRLALGASAGDLARWLTAESLVLALAGGALGVLLAYWFVDAAAPLLSALPRSGGIRIDVRVVAFTVAVSAVSAVGFGVAPLRRVLRQMPVDALRGSRAATRGRGGAAGALVIGEVAISLVLLIAAALLLESFARLLAAPVGFNPERLLTMFVSLPTSRYPNQPAMRAFMDRLMPQLEATPGVASAASAMMLPPNATVRAPFQAADAPDVGIGRRPVALWSAVTPRYFETMGIPLLEGRRFSPADNETAPLVVVVSANLARRVWPGQSALGKKLHVGRFPSFAEVVGVAADIKNAGLAAAPEPIMYTPYAQRPWPTMGIVVRTVSPDPLTMTNAIRHAVLAIDPDEPVTDIHSMDAALADSIAGARLVAEVLALFAAVALIMAAAGLYGVIAYSVEQRTREIGVRVALGAEPTSVLALVARDGARLAIAGVAIGAVAAVAIGRLVRTLVAGVEPASPATYALVVVVFLAIAALACIVPARRALRVDPLIALRAE